jgi:hypothetical protein
LLEAEGGPVEVADLFQPGGTATRWVRFEQLSFVD